MHLRIFFFFAFSVFVLFFFLNLIHISQMDIFMTAKHVMHNIFFLSVFNKHNRGDIQLRFKQNKHHPFNPMFSMIFFLLQTNASLFFHSLKYYTVKKNKNPNMYSFTLSCNFLLGGGGGGGRQQPCSATICQNTFWSWQNGIVQCLQFLCFTQRVLITVVHDKISTYSHPKNAATQVFTFH